MEYGFTDQKVFLKHSNLNLYCFLKEPFNLGEMKIIYFIMYMMKKYS